MKFRALFVLVTTLICVQHVCSGILVSRNEKVKDKYSESVRHVQIRSVEEKDAVNESDSTAPLASGLVQNFDVISKKGETLSEEYKETLTSTNVPEVREIFLPEKLKPLNRTRKSNFPPRPTVCFEFPSQNPYEPSSKICEPITVAREAPNDVNIVRYNPYVGIQHSSTPLVVLPPYHVSQFNPAKTTVHPTRFPPSYGPQPAGDNYMSPHLYPAPTVQLPSSLPPSLTNDLSLANATFLSTWLTDYGYQPLGIPYISPLKENAASSQLPASVPSPPLNEIIPVKIMLPSPWASSFGVQPAENSHKSPPNQYMTPAQLPVNLPPHLTSQNNPVVTIPQSFWTPNCGFQPDENRYMSPPNQYITAAPFPASFSPPSMSENYPAKTMLPSPWPSRYGFQPVQNSYISPTNQYKTSMQLTENLPLPFTNEMNSDRTILPPFLPPGYGIQESSYYQFPSAQIPSRWSPTQMYYIHSPPSAYPIPYPPFPFYVYGNTNKAQLSNSKTPVNASTSKSGVLHTIKEQEETHKVPTPLEEAEKSQGLLSSRSANNYPYIQPEKFPTLPYSLNVAYKEHLAESNVPVAEWLYPSYEYSPSSVVHFTPGQNPSHVPVTTKTERFGPPNPPAALTCKVHNSEEKEVKQTLADDSIAVLQLFLKPNPSRHSKYRESDPESVNNIAGNANNRDSVKRPMVQYAGTTSTSMQHDGLSDVRGKMTKLKEDWISSQEMKNIYEDKRNIEGIKWLEDQEKRAMQQYLEHEMPPRRGVNIQALQTVQPWAWHQGYFLPPQVPIHPERFYANGYNIRQLPCYHSNHWPDQSRVPIQWWGEQQTQLWTPQYRQETQFLPGQQSPMHQELRNKELLLKSTQNDLNLKEKQRDLNANPSSESGQGKGNETLNKQNRLNTVKAKLLQQYQWEAEEKRQRARQMSLSGLLKETNNLSKSEAIQLNTGSPSMEKRKVSDVIGETVQTTFRNAPSSKSATTDVLTSIFRDAKESTADVKIEGKNSNDSLFTVKPVAFVVTEILAQQRDMMSLDHLKDKQLNNGINDSFSEATDKTVDLDHLKDKQLNNVTKDSLSEVTDKSMELDHLKDKQLNNVTKDSLSEVANKSVDLDHLKDEQRNNVIKNSFLEVTNKSVDLDDLKDKQLNNVIKASFSEVTNKTVDSIQITNKHEEYVKKNDEFARTSAQEISGSDSLTSSSESSADHQMNSEYGFPPTPKTEHSTRYLQDESVRKFKMNPILVQSQDKFVPSSRQVRPKYHTPSFPLETMGFLIYPNGVLPTHHYTGKERGPGQFPNMVPYSYMYPIPLTPAYSLRSNPHIHSNTPSKNIYEGSGMVAERNSKPAEKNINEQTIEGTLPFTVVLEEH
jgi:hypothetical protein